MNKFEYLKEYADRYSLYKKQAWVLSLFALTMPQDLPPFPGKIIYELGYPKFYDNELLKFVSFDDGVKNTPLFKLQEEITIEDPISKNIINTTIGIYLANLICIVLPFKGKIPYINGVMDVNAIKDIIAPRLRDNPKPGEIESKEFIYVYEYKLFIKSLNYMGGLTQISVVAYTEKTLLPAPGIQKYKKELLAANKDNLDDPIVISDIEKKLNEYDQEFLKGDPLMRFRTMVRKRLFQMYGAEKGIGDTTKRKLSTNSLDEGWELSSLPDYVNASRAGSFNRGSETQLGGELVKWLLRASSNISVDMDDCGTALGYRRFIGERDYGEIVGLNIISGNNILAIASDEDAKKYIGKTVTVRSPLYCKNPGINYCKKCLGERLTLNERGISIAVADLGSTIMLSFMGAMHGKDLQVAKLDLGKLVS